MSGLEVLSGNVPLGQSITGFDPLRTFGKFRMDGISVTRATQSSRMIRCVPCRPSSGVQNGFNDYL